MKPDLKLMQGTYQDAVNVFIFTKLAQIQISINNLDRRIK